MNRLETKKAASDIAYETAAQNSAAADAAVAAKAVALQLTDPQYQQFRGDFGMFRQQFAAAAAADAVAARNTKPAPAVTPAAPAKA